MATIKGAYSEYIVTCPNIPGERPAIKIEDQTGESLVWLDASDARALAHALLDKADLLEITEAQEECNA